MSRFALYNFFSLRPSPSTEQDPSVKKIIKGFALAIIFVILLFLFVNNQNTRDIKIVKIAGENIKVDLAQTPNAQAQGLSGRSMLKNDGGMLFVFDHSDKYSFWMKDMNFHIDIIWLDQNMKVVYIKKNATPESYPDSFTPNQNAKYVLEVISGFSDKHNLKTGDNAEFASQ